MTTKNLQGKTRPKDDPWQVYVGPGSWVWRVLKHYQSPAKEAVNPYARVLCNVTSPYCPDGETGDVYLSEILRNGVLQPSADQQADAYVAAFGGKVVQR